MGSTSRRIQLHKSAKNQIKNLCDNDAHNLVIHYSSESFYDIKDGKTPRVTSIAVRYLKTAQTKSFSIHKVAELRKISHHDIDANYDTLEKEMLDDFFSFVKEHKDYRWIHWNMRDINYGFEALKHRASVLGATVFEIKDENKFDLARLMIDKYGKGYSDHPRLPSILAMNNLSPKHWLDGAAEAEAFVSKDFVRLHQSTLAKVDVIDNILKLAGQEQFKSKSSLINIYGLNPQGLFELIKDHWLFALIMTIIGFLINYFIS